MPTASLPVVAVGSFDGVHLGHHRILDHAARLARERSSPLAVLTFDPLPAQLIHPDFTYVLTPLEEKVELLCELGVEAVEVVRFDAAARGLGPAEFIERHLLALEPSAVVVGHDHRFGKGRAGDADFLGTVLGPRNIQLEVVSEYTLDDVPVRSTTIREQLLLGHVAAAARLLGRHYRLAGRVITGTGTGRTIGFPTMNLQVNELEKLVPADGVYAVRAEVEGAIRPAVLNIGHRPTFRGEKRTIEAHLFECELHAPPEAAAVRFVERLRPERKFPDPQTLAGQIARDVADARRFLAGS